MRAAVLALAAVLAFTSPCWAAGPQGEPVVVGVLYNLTGAMASIDVPGLEGMKLAAARVNAEGGLLGRPLRLEVRDCASDVERCRTAARELADMGVVAMAGLNDSDYALVAGETSVMAGIPFVTAGATLPTLPRLLGPNFFMACFGDDAQAKAVAKFALRHMGVESMLVMTNRDHAFTTALSGYFVRRYRERGGEIPFRASFSQTSPPAIAGDAAACLKNGGCRGVFVAGMPGDAVDSVRALRAARYAGPVFSGDGFDTGLLSGLNAEEASPGIFFSTHVAYDSPRPEVKRFVGEWTAVHGAPPSSGFAALGYDALGLVARAVKASGSTGGAPVRRALAATRGYQGATGEIGYPQPLAPPLKTVFVMRYDGSGRALAGEVLP
ncbi:MAG: ABC transporter substrate-binding protein [Thermodesulfobacteriota bacterium]|jgi:branched-chain amino acid transport system substrate-binding protein